MPYYYPNKPEADAAALKYQPYWITQTTMVPYNGWVITLYPASIDVLKYPLYDLLEHVELNLGSMRKLPPGHKKPEALESKQTKAPPPPPPPPPKMAPKPVKQPPPAPPPPPVR